MKMDKNINIANAPAFIRFEVSKLWESGKIPFFNEMLIHEENMFDILKEIFPEKENNFINEFWDDLLKEVGYNFVFLIKGERYYLGEEHS
jgi:hypothetical protein